MMRNCIIASGLALLVAGCGSSSEQTPPAQTGSTAPMTTTAAATANVPARTARATPNVQELPVHRTTVMRMQASLKVKGFYRGPVDGIVGPETRTALANYKQSQGMPQTAALDEKTLQELIGGTTIASRSMAKSTASNESTAESGSTAGPMMNADQVKDQLQSQGWSNVSDVRPWGSDAYTARAEKNGQSQTVEVNGHTGQVFGAQ